MTTLPVSAVRRRPAGTGAVNGSSLGLNIGLIVGIAAGVVVLFIVLGYAVNRYRRCRGGADCGSYRLNSDTRTCAKLMSSPRLSQRGLLMPRLHVLMVRPLMHRRHVPSPLYGGTSSLIAARTVWTGRRSAALSTRAVVTTDSSSSHPSRHCRRLTHLTHSFIHSFVHSLPPPPLGLQSTPGGGCYGTTSSAAASKLPPKEWYV